MEEYSSSNSNSNNNNNKNNNDNDKELPNVFILEYLQESWQIPDREEDFGSDLLNEHSECPENQDINILNNLMKILKIHLVTA